MSPTSPELCKHTVVRIVSRTEDAEFVECQSCGEIFDSIEYEDMAREAALSADGESDPDDADAPLASAPKAAARPAGKPRRKR